MGYKAIIVDDGINDVEVLKNILSMQYPEIDILKVYTDSRNALEYLLVNKPDLVFLHIQMQNLSGIELIKQFKNPEFHVIFTTDDDQFDVEGVTIETLDYLLKPIDKENLTAAVNRFIQKSLILKDQEQSVQKEMIVKNERNKKLTVKLQNQILFLDHADIVYLEADSNYTKFYLSDGKTHLASKTIKHFETKINNTRFFRLHQSYLVNTKYIKAYSRVENCVVLANDIKIPVSRNKKEALLTRLGD